MNNQPAFPSKESSELLAQGQQFNGMSLRDYFAAHADIPWDAVIFYAEKSEGFKPKECNYEQFFKFRAQMKYREADAMLKAREEVK